MYLIKKYKAVNPAKDQSALMRTNRFVCCNLQLNEVDFDVKFGRAGAAGKEGSYRSNLLHYAN